jgi:hypothetical protein
MTLPRTMADVLLEHVVFEVESIDRMYFNYQPKLQYGGGASAFFVGHRGQLRVHGMIERIPRTHRYRVTDNGFRHALFLTRLHTRFLRPGLAHLSGQPPPVPSPLRAADRDAIDNLARQAGLAA